MKIEIHKSGNLTIAEIISEEILIGDIETGKDLLADYYYQGYDGVIVQTKNITNAFFDLKTGIAGEILQLAANFRMKFGIVGDFSQHNSKALNDFIWESNRQGKFVFKSSLLEVLNGFT